MLDNGPMNYITDGSQQSLAAIPGAASLAGLFAVPLNVVHLIPKVEQPHVQADRVARIRAALPPDAAHAEVVVTPFAHFTRSEQSRFGTAALLASRNAGLRRLVGGNNYDPLLRWGVQPVLALPGSGEARAIRRVLFPLDLSPRSDDAFNATIALCQSLNAELHTLHVFGDDRLPPSEQDQALRAAAQSPLELFQIDKRRLEQLVALPHNQHIRTVAQTAEGRAHIEIAKYAAAHEIDLIVMATHGPRSFEDVLRGSTTVRVIQRASVPVLAVRSNAVPTRERTVGV